MSRGSPACGKQAINGSIIIIFLSCGANWIIFWFLKTKSCGIRSSENAERVVTRGLAARVADTAPHGSDLSAFPSLLLQ